MPAPGGEELTRSHLRALGCTEPEAAQILALLKEEDRLAPYLHRAERQQIHCLTRGNPRYPPRLITAMGDRAPAVLWFSGNLSLLQTPCLSLVGSRELRDANRAFARAAEMCIRDRVPRTMRRASAEMVICMTRSVVSYRCV